MAVQRIGIIMHDVSGRMGDDQHLVRSIAGIRTAGGVALPKGDRAISDPILVGRNAETLAEIAGRYGIERHSGDRDAALQTIASTVAHTSGAAL